LYSEDESLAIRSEKELLYNAKCWFRLECLLLLYVAEVQKARYQCRSKFPVIAVQISEGQESNASFSRYLLGRAIDWY
jgi:hypothetical protein